MVFVTTLPTLRIKYSSNDCSRVDDGGVVGDGPRHQKAVFAIDTLVHGKAALFETIGHKRGDLFVIFDYEDAHSIGP